MFKIGLSNLNSPRTSNSRRCMSNLCKVTHCQSDFVPIGHNFGYKSPHEISCLYILPLPANYNFAGAIIIGRQFTQYKNSQWFIAGNPGVGHQRV